MSLRCSRFCAAFGTINAEMNARGFGVMRRVCRSCGAVFVFEYSRGRPRERCFVCQPPGTRVIVQRVEQLRPLASSEASQ